MNQKLLKAVSLSLATVFAVPFVSVLASCDNESGKKGNRNEDEVLVFSTGEFDGVFNPFFSTSAYDSTIAGQTQISMLGSDENGNGVTYGVDEPVVALDYNETMYEDKNGTKVTTSGDEEGITVYQIVLKKDIKFSDGEPLTAHDVLFNMYVYLDKVYSGSSTMYSTKIQGLEAYQYQDPNINASAASALDKTFASIAYQRVQTISDYVQEKKTWQISAETYTDLCADAKIPNVTYGETEIKADIENIKTWWKEELTTDWTANTSDMASYEKEYSFTKEWQAYFYAEGLVSRKRDDKYPNAVVYLKDANGKYIIDWENAGIDPNANYTKDQAIDAVYNAFLSDEEYISTILGGWQTGSKASERYANEAMELYLETTKKPDGEAAVPSISGIQILDAKDFKGAKTYEEGAYEMLQVTIDGVDPKAKWNFAFTVAPMHYYSTPELTAAALADTTYSSNFGVKPANNEFMDSLKRRNSVPMGAGIYQASTDRDYTYVWSTDAAKEAQSFNKLADEFVSDNVAHFVRNEYFYTTGGNVNEVYNAKIKHVRYKVVNSNNTMTALQDGSIAFADPSATAENIATIEKDENKHLDHIEIPTAGYGYIGINASFINDINIRRALMSVMDVSLVQSYYPSTLSEPIYRGFSKTSWVYNAYPEAGVAKWEPESYYGFDETFETAKDYLEDAGCKLNAANKWVDKDGKLLEFTFTVAGDSFDHPAYQTFLKARTILLKYGVSSVEVVSDSRALSKLASGGLAVWAAAWSSTVDPDMYQVYHMKSKATSVKNWGYDWIKKNTSSEDYKIVEELSGLIEDARETIDNATRTEIYREAADLVMDLAVELPVYQRCDMYVYNKTVLDSSTFIKKATPYAGPLNKMWQVSFVL